MTTQKRLDRKEFLASVAAWGALSLSGCSDDDEKGGTGGSGGAATGGTSTGGSSTGGSSTGGSGGSGPPTYACTSDTNNGDHAHPLAIVLQDVAQGYHQDDVPWVLEDGGTGHTHTVSLSPYDFLDLQGGTEVTVASSETANHTHECVVACVRS